MADIQIKGMTWSHSRGFLPMVATAQRYREENKDISIEWEYRSLQQFGDLPLTELAKRYDLLVIDHPFVGRAASQPVLAPLDEWLSTDYLQEQAHASVGRSFESYRYGGHQWALAIDAATPVSGWREDLLRRFNLSVPRTWEDLLEIAAKGHAIVPAVPTDSLMNVYMLCTALGEDPFVQAGQFVTEEVGIQALEALKTLVDLCGERCLSMNPIAVWEELAGGSNTVYCPFAYGYSNYSRPGYALHAVTTGPLIEWYAGNRLRSTLGGAGLAVSATCPHKNEAAAYARYVGQEICQRTLYFESGGQPGHLAAWQDEEVNRRSNDFFRQTLSTLKSAYLRPRFAEYAPLQEALGHLVHSFLKSETSAESTLQKMNRLCLERKSEAAENGAVDVP